MKRLFGTALAALWLAACSGETAPVTPENTEEPADAGPPELSATDLAQQAENLSLVPSPVETQRALAAAGIGTSLHELIADRAFNSFEGKDHDHVAVTTGVYLSDMLLSVKTSSTDELLAHLEYVKEGLRHLGGSTDIIQLLNDMQERVKADAITRDELLKEMDELSGALIPEMKFNDNERIVPLIQAGTWLEGANLVAKAVRNSEDPSAAEALLKQPAVVSYFLTYVQTEGSEAAPAAVTAQLKTALETLKALSEKSEPLSQEDVETVIQTTDAVLALL